LREHARAHLADYKIRERRSPMLMGKCRNGRDAIPDLQDEAGAGEARMRRQGTSGSPPGTEEGRVYASTLKGVRRDLAH
jgi:hypothetical protein